MTKVSEVIHDPLYIACLDHGFVGLKDHMGSDADIVQAARVSYGKGTRAVSEDRGLIRYLVSHKHTSPIEMGEVKLHLKLPIFVMRQLVRHRTSSLNEYSGRYSVMSDEFYIPALDQIKPQSQDNKQGRAGDLDPAIQDNIRNAMVANSQDAYAFYTMLITPADEELETFPGVEPEVMTFPGIAREIARTVLPVSNYTELFWKQDLHNLLHLIKLRRDAHAQYEIRVFAEAIYQLIKPLFPLTCEAWEDYVWEAETSSRMEAAILRQIVSQWKEQNPGAAKLDASACGMSQREMKAFMTKWRL